jgi:hypothetical protein
MILNNAPQNEAVLSNVGEIGEFRIRNSAKAFNILSSGLYANKVRAIIRELSCNAVDSHAAAGKKDTPFDVHLPNQLEPWFSVRDYGTGLSHAQVTNIYTTYFESTKTASNEFIGALGLGSKSPFSYTDNFTVTAVQDGRRGIYSAFINAEGVPSIAVMMEEDTTEPNGVEVKFSVNDRYDFDKFRQEARNVYRYFSLRPVIAGSAEFRFDDIEYDTRDIVPGVHSRKNDGSQSVAVMGNIAYPIQIPDADGTLGDLRSLLRCGLEIHFGIGELDFQASREGLSYIPATIAAIKRKLDAVNGALLSVLAKEADAIENLWERAEFLYTKKDSNLWSGSVRNYAIDTKLSTFDAQGYMTKKVWKLKLDELATKYNIQIRGFHRSRGSKTVNTVKSATEWSTAVNANGRHDTWSVWEFSVNTENHFVINDLKTGAGERAKFHYRTTEQTCSRSFFVIEAVDRTKAMDVDAFFAEIQNPPKKCIVNASSLLEKPRAGGIGKNVSILQLERRGGRGYRRADEDMVWRDAGKFESFDATQTYYYVPLSGFTMESKKGYSNGKSLYDDASAMPGLFSGTIYGVRKKDIEAIKTQKNWINFEDHIAKTLNGKDVSKLLMSLVKSEIDGADFLQYNNDAILKYLSADSLYAKLVSQFVKVEKFRGNIYNLRKLFQTFAPNANLSPDALIKKYQSEANAVAQRYPLLKSLSSHRVESADVAEYINLIDSKKEV